MVRVLVTGATGFIGQKLVEELLTRDDQVSCLVRRTSQTESLTRAGARLVYGDVRDPESVRAAVDGAHTVYHLAGVTRAFRLAEMMATNAEGIRNVAAACAAQPNPPVLLSVSSLAAAGPSPGAQPRHEGDPAAPVSHYGQAKRAGELIAEEYADRVPITVVRPPIVFGEGDPLMRDMFRVIYRYGIHFALGVARFRYSLIYVRDLAGALILCAHRGTRLPASKEPESPHTADGYYFAAAQEQPTFAELGQWIGQCLGRQRTVVLRSRGPVALWTAAMLGELVGRMQGVPHIFNFDKVREAKAGNWTCSTDTIRRELGFTASSPVVERLQQTADWYRHKRLL